MSILIKLLIGALVLLGIIALFTLICWFILPVLFHLAWIVAKFVLLITVIVAVVGFAIHKLL